MVSFIPIEQAGLIKTGDVLQTETFLPFLNHFAIAFQKDATMYVADNVYFTGKVEITPYDIYKTKRKIISVGRGPELSALTDQQVMDKVNEAKTINYRFFKFNCQDFVEQVCNCSIGPDQRPKWAVGILMALAFIAVLILLFGKHK